MIEPPQNEAQASQNRSEYAADRKEWLVALVDQGFSREEAMAILTAPTVHVSNNTVMPPEMTEWVAKMNLLADDAISDR
jgi:uncharacterized protein YllA (UPF0747 family)